MTAVKILSSALSDEAMSATYILLKSQRRVQNFMLGSNVGITNRGSHNLQTRRLRSLPEMLDDMAVDPDMMATPVKWAGFIFGQLGGCVLNRAANARGPGDPAGSLGAPSRTLGSSPDRERTIENATALVPGPLARL